MGVKRERWGTEMVYYSRKGPTCVRRPTRSPPLGGAAAAQCKNATRIQAHATLEIIMTWRGRAQKTNSVY